MARKGRKTSSVIKRKGPNINRRCLPGKPAGERTFFSPSETVLVFIHEKGSPI
jgi:hypothetical protein